MARFQKHEDHGLQKDPPSVSAQSDQQSVLTAIAMNEWDIQRGCETVARIRLPFLLRRIASGARQDAIRLSAALALDDRALIREVSLNARDITIRWRGAYYLEDPLLMTDVALFKQTDERFEAIRIQAHSKLIKHLDNLQWKGDGDAVEAYLRDVQHTPYKVEAFVRLPAKAIQPALLRYMASQDYRYTPQGQLKHLFIKVQASGWQVTQSHHSARCTYCRGQGWLLLSARAADMGATATQTLPCPECNASGKVSYQKISCLHNSHPPVVFRLVEVRS
jgi:hypothetical protein